MPPFDLQESMRRAEERFAQDSFRRPRRDRGGRRLAPEVLREITAALYRHERPRVKEILDRLEELCRARGHARPSRATIYQLMASVPPPSYRIESLPPHVRETLYNLPASGDVPGPQLAFHCFNYGGVAAMSFAAGLPWLVLYQASRLRGWRPRSRGVLTAVLAARGI